MPKPQRFFRYSCPLIACIFSGFLLSACAPVNTAPDPKKVEQCQLNIDELQQMITEAANKKLTTSKAYIRSARILTQSRNHLRNGSIYYCLNDSARGLDYMDQLLNHGNDVQ
ncbi:hypothetical protein [Kaarinaea lacus]